MRTLGSFNHPGPMKSRSRSCSATALAAREHAIRRSAARFRRLPGPGRSSWNGCTIAVRANTRSIAARREHRCFHTPNALRCVSKHEGTRLLARPHPSRRAHTRSSLRQHSRMRAPQDEDEHRVLQSSPYKQPFSSPRRFRRGTRWLVRSLYFPVFLRIRNLPSPVSRSQTTRSPSFPRRIFAPGVLHRCFTHPESRGGGAPRDVRVRAKHPLGLHMTRQARRLRGALRPMTRALVSRRSTRGGFSPGAALASPA